MIHNLLVVYRPFPTSNHNGLVNPSWTRGLYIVRFLHQTTTLPRSKQSLNELYIVRFLHQTTTKRDNSIITPKLYIVRFLHQTTTVRCCRD